MAAQIEQLIQKLGLPYQVVTLCTLPRQFNRKRLQSDIDDFLSEYGSQPFNELDISAALNNLTGIIRNHHLILPASLSMLIRLLMMLEGTSQLLDRNFSLTGLLKPYTRKMVTRRMAPKRFANRMRKSLKSWDRFLTALPRDLEATLSRMREGKFDVHLEHRHLDAVVNRMVYGILSGAVFLGGCMVLSSGVPPLFKGVSVIGAAIILLGGALAFRLLRAVALSGNLVNKKEM